MTPAGARAAAGARRALYGLLLLAAAGGPAAARDLAAVHYDLILAEHCGLLDGAVAAGWRGEVDALVAAGKLDEAAQRAAVSAASIAFETEWGNRGLGGSGPWCRNEGAEGAARLAAYPDG